MRRIDAIQEIVSSRWGRDGLIVSNLGYASREVYALSDGPNVFYMLGSMGLASSIGLGLSLVRRRRHVLVLDGDGSVLMNLGTLATVANFAAPNFHLFILDNGVHGSTGNQKSHTAMNTDLLKVSTGAGVKDARSVDGTGELRRLLMKHRLPRVVVVRCTPFNADVPVISLSPIRIRKRFGRYLSRAG